MGDTTSARTSRTHVRRGAVARALAVLALAFLGIVGAATTASAAGFVGPGHSGPAQAGQPEYFSIGLTGDDCPGMAVTFAISGGDSKTVSATGDPDACAAGTSLVLPTPTSCPGGPGTVTVSITMTDASATDSVLTKCPAVKPTPDPKPTKKPPKSPSATPTPTPTDTPSESPTPSTSPTPQPSTAKPETKPAKEEPEVARQAALLVPVDDGGPQPPTVDTGPSPMHAVTALGLLFLGGLATALVWRLGATRAVVGGVVAGTLVLASAPLVLPAVTSTEPAPSTAVRLRTATGEATVPAGRSGTATATCPAGSALVGGGLRTSGDGASAAEVSASLPAANGWTVTATAAEDAITLTAVAQCTTDLGVVTATAAGLPASLSAGDTARTSARCADGRPLALGWSGTNTEAVAGLPLAEGATVISWGEKDAATSATNLLCATSASTAWPLRYDSDQVEIPAGTEGTATAACPAGNRAVGGGYVAAASVGGRVAPVTVIEAAPESEGFVVEVAADASGTGVLLTSYALCLPAY